MAQSTSSRKKTVLISGAGVAGPALAYWLLRAGMVPVLVESAPTLRTGGYMIDFWGLGFEVAEQMHLAERLRQIGYKIQELRLVNARGGAFIRLGVGLLTESLGERYVSLQRGDLAATLFEALQGRVETIFDDEVTSLIDTGKVVAATFRHQPSRLFDLVIGADGLHSNIRRLAFGDGADFEVPLGYYFAAFTAANYPHRDKDAYVSRTTVSRQAARYALRGGRTAFFMIVSADLSGGRPLSTHADQREFLASAFADIGWEGRDMLSALSSSDDLYFDSVSQVHMPTWWTGRVAFVGDAAHGPSLLAGEGAALAMLGAYTLAGELVAAGGDYRAAFPAYERRLRPLMDRKQRMALRMGSWFAPKTPFGLLIRNQISRLAGLPGLSGLILGPMVSDKSTLPSYEWPAAAAATATPTAETTAPEAQRG